MSEHKEHDAYYAQGWVEVLHRQDKLPAPVTLEDLTPDQYTQVGSNLPLCEYYSPIDIYQQFERKPEKGFKIPRGFKAYDAVNLCSSELDRIVTLMFIPRSRLNDMSRPGTSIQCATHLPLLMMVRPNIFESFYLSSQEK